MTLFTRTAVVAIALVAPLSVAQAQPAQDPHHPPAQMAPQQRPMPPGRAAPHGAMPQGQAGGMMMGGDMGQMMQMMQMMRGMMAQDGMMPMSGPGRMQPFAHIEGQLAFYRTELAIPDA